MRNYNTDPEEELDEEGMPKPPVVPIKPPTQSL